MKRVYYALMFLLIFSCSPKQEKIAEIEIDINPNAAEGFIGSEDILDTVGCALVPLADTEKPIVRVTKLQVQNSKYYILDENTHCLHVFGHDGKALFSIDRQGKAGNEYLHLTDFHATKENIYLLDFLSKKILVCDSLGKFQKKIDIGEYWANGLSVIGKDLYLINDDSKPQAGAFHFFQIDEDGKCINKLLPFELQAGFGSDKDYASFGNGEFLYCQAPINTVYQVTQDGCKPILDINFGSRALPEDYYTLNLRELLRKGYAKNYVLGIDKIFASDNYIFLKYRYGENNYWIIYDRGAQKVKKHCRGFGPENMYQMGLSDFTVQDGWVYEISPAYDFIQHQKYYTPKPPLEPRYEKELQEVAQRVTEMSNPVLIQYKLK